MSNEIENTSVGASLTDTYTWTGADGESKVIVESPTETTELTGGSVIFTDRATGEKGSVVLTNIENNLILRAENELSFKDGNTGPITLTELATVNGGGGGTGGRLGDLSDVTITAPRAGDVIKYTATGWVNGADAVSGGPDGNACGTPESYLRRNIDEEITGTYTWKGPDGVSKVIVESPTETTQVRGGAILFTSKDTGENGRIQIANASNDIFFRADNRLMFKDSQLDAPISLAELAACCDGSGGGSGGASGTTFAPIIRNFTIDIAECNTDGAAEFGVDATGQSGTIIYGSNWSELVPSGRVFGAITTNTKSIDMPDGANGAIVFLQNQVELGAGSDPNMQASGSQRALHCSQRCEVTGANFPIDPNNTNKTGFGETVKSIVQVPGNTESVVTAYRNSKSFDKFDLINFTNQATVTFRLRLDILKGGRGRFEARAGRIVILPFFSQNPSEFSLPNADNGFVYTTDEELNAIYDEISPVETPAETAMIAGMEYRNLLRRIVVSLESRKDYPPAVDGATPEEFNARIQEAWELVDNSTLQTQEEFEAALSVYYTEVTKEKYGIAFLFQFEQEAGSTVRGLI